MAPSLTLAEVVDRLCSGEEGALDLLMEQTRPMAYRLAFSILSDRDRCQDVLQDVYWSTFQNISQLRDRKSFRGWFTRILVHRCRKELSRQVDFLEDLPDPENLVWEAPRWEDGLVLNQALEQLTVADRALLTSREVLGLSYQEIAEALEIPIGTVGSRIFKARQRLLARFRKESLNHESL